jgi:hypothetical protein
MTRFFSIDAANAAIPELRTILETLRDERSQLIALRDEFARQTAREAAPTPGDPAPPEPLPAGTGDDPADGEGRRRLRLRMQGVIDQMQAGVARIDELGVTLREIETGLIDFPALVSGRQVWLCWRLGEGEIESWHELGDGFGGRQALVDLS